MDFCVPVFGNIKTMMMKEFAVTVKLSIKLFLILLVIGKSNSEVCAAYHLDKHERVREGEELRMTIDLPLNVSLVVWHSPNISCIGETSYTFSQCDVTDTRIACSDLMPGYQAVLRDAQDLMEDWKETKKAGANSNPSANTGSTTSSQTNAKAGYRFYMKIRVAKRSFESLGSSITYTTIDGERTTMRAFRPQMVYTPAYLNKYTCSNVTIDGVSYIYYELTAIEIAPLLECQLIDRPDISFTYVYERPPEDVEDDPSGKCTCLVPVSSANNETQTFRMRAKTKGVRSINVTHAGGKVITSAGSEPYPFNETLKVRGQEVLLPAPGREFITFSDLHLDIEQNKWREVVIDTDECMKSEESYFNVEPKEALGLITLDQKTCPMYMADGQVTNCRCHVTARGHAYSSDLSVTWREEGVAKRRFITTGVEESSILAFKYKGTPSQYICTAKNVQNLTVETLAYLPQDIDYREKEQADHRLVQLWTVFIAALVNLVAFIGHYIYTIWKKQSPSYQDEFNNFFDPVAAEEIFLDENSAKSD